MKPCVIILILFWQCCCCESFLNAADADILWSRAVNMAQQGQVDLAFINFRMLVDSYPDSPKSPAAQFGLGEYYFLQNNFALASQEFENFYVKYPKKQESVIALAYLYKIAQMRGQKEAVSRYQKRIASAHPVAFIFKDSKIFQYSSGLQHKYKLVLYIDRIEVLVDGKSFVKISY